MFSYAWPIALIVLSNIVYHICAKSTPDAVNPFASLTVTYLVGTVCSVMAFLLTAKGEGLLKEFGKMNWTSYVLGIVILGLEAGNIYAYKAGWQVSTQAIVQSSILAIALVVVGFMLYNEQLTWNKLVGIGICMVGLFFINMK